MIKKTIFLFFFLISTANASSLPLIGLDSKGTPKEILISKKKWDSKLKESISLSSFPIGIEEETTSHGFPPRP